MFVNIFSRKPRLVFGYNTETNYKKNISNASDSDEARWNFAFWLQNEEIVIGDNYEEEDFKELILRDRWVKASKWYYCNICLCTENHEHPILLIGELEYERLLLLCWIIFRKVNLSSHHHFV